MAHPRALGFSAADRKSSKEGKHNNCQMTSLRKIRVVIPIRAVIDKRLDFEARVNLYKAEEESILSSVPSMDWKRYVWLKVMIKLFDLISWYLTTISLHRFVPTHKLCLKLLQSQQKLQVK